MVRPNHRPLALLDTHTPARAYGPRHGHLFIRGMCANAIRNSYTMGCPPVCVDNPRALASGLSSVQVDKHCITIPPTSV